MWVCICIHVYMYLCVYVCVYIYVYMYLSAYIYRQTRPTKSEILTIWPFADTWSKVSALPHNTFSSQFTLLRLLYPSIPCDCSCQGKQYFPCCQVQGFPVTYLSTALYTGGSSLLVIPFPPSFHDLYSHFFLPTAHCANTLFSVKLKV